MTINNQETPDWQTLFRSLAEVEARADLFGSGRKVVVGLPSVTFDVGEQALNGEHRNARIDSAMTELDGHGRMLQQRFYLAEQPSDGCDRSMLRHDFWNRTVNVNGEGQTNLLELSWSAKGLDRAPAT